MTDMIEKTEKVDKGFCFNYWQLSYRRKFIRTLWQMPIMLVVAVACFLFVEELHVFKIPHLTPQILSVLIIFASTIQLAYNYIRWKRETQL
ncbi:MAG: hypothetical protein FWD00_02700 [Clostridiales bacterium]|nr:hypothetical protein [Clostridiales bacterium]